MFRSKIPSIRLRHLLAQSNTHMAFSWMLPEGQRHDWPVHGVLEVRGGPVVFRLGRRAAVCLELHGAHGDDDLSHRLVVTPLSSVLTACGHWEAPLQNLQLRATGCCGAERVSIRWVSGSAWGTFMLASNKLVFVFRGFVLEEFLFDWSGFMCF